MSEATSPIQEFDIRHYSSYARYLLDGFDEDSFVVCPPLVPKKLHLPNPEAEDGFSEADGTGYTSSREEAEASFFAARRTALVVRHKAHNVAAVHAPEQVAKAARHTPDPNLFAFLVRHTDVHA
jgi:hypothetical protein